MLRYLLLVVFLHLSVQQGAKDDWPQKACDFEKCSKTFNLDMDTQGVKVDVKSDTKYLFLAASDDEGLLVKLNLRAESGKVLATIGDCKQKELGIQKESLQGLWAVKVSKDRIQTSFNGIMVIYYNFDEPCSKDFTETDSYTMLMFDGIEDSDDIEVSPLTSDANDCPYNQFPDTSDCTRDGDKCYAKAIIYCACGGLSWWNEENCKNSEKPEEGGMVLDCDMCLGDSDNDNSGGENKTCHDWEWGRDDCMDYGDGCKSTRYPKECKCDHGCDKWPDKMREWCEPHECTYHSPALSVKVSAVFMVSAAVGPLLR